jgi:transcriptional regulator with XRE-family HTH domain
MKQIRKIREENGIKQKDLAARCGLRQATISDIEKGRIKNPRIGTLLKIAKQLGVSVDSLFNSVE